MLLIKVSHMSNILSNTKEWFSGMGKGWQIPAVVGVITAVAISGPVGLGVAGGMWASSRVAGDSAVNKVKNAALMGLGAATCAASTLVGAAIGSFVFPVVGTLIGAGVGMFGGMVASRRVTKRVKEGYNMEKVASKVEGYADELLDVVDGKHSPSKSKSRGTKVGKKSGPDVSKGARAIKGKKNLSGVEGGVRAVSEKQKMKKAKGRGR